MAAVLREQQLLPLREACASPGRGWATGRPLARARAMQETQHVWPPPRVPPTRTARFLADPARAGGALVCWVVCAALDRLALPDLDAEEEAQVQRQHEGHVQQQLQAWRPVERRLRHAARRAVIATRLLIIGARRSRAERPWGGDVATGTRPARRTERRWQLDAELAAHWRATRRAARCGWHAPEHALGGG
eukprot:5387390-Prymnesium_polylepis.1